MDILTLKFQSTHPQGVRLLTRLNQHLKRGFNPRTRRGCDPDYSGGCAGLSVSIHAPAGGATYGLARHKALDKFQSTHPQGVRHVTRRNT